MNRRPLVLEATALPIEPQPLPIEFHLLGQRKLSFRLLKINMKPISVGQCRLGGDLEELWIVWKPPLCPKP